MMRCAIAIFLSLVAAGCSADVKAVGSNGFSARQQHKGLLRDERSETQSVANALKELDDVSRSTAKSLAKTFKDEENEYRNWIPHPKASVAAIDSHMGGGGSSHMGGGNSNTNGDSDVHLLSQKGGDKSLSSAAHHLDDIWGKLQKGPQPSEHATEWAVTDFNEAISRDLAKQRKQMQAGEEARAKWKKEQVDDMTRKANAAQGEAKKMEMTSKDLAAIMKAANAQIMSDKNPKEIVPAPDMDPAGASLLDVSSLADDLSVASAKKANWLDQALGEISGNDDVKASAKDTESKGTSDWLDQELKEDGIDKVDAKADQEWLGEAVKKIKALKNPDDYPDGVFTDPDNVEDLDSSSEPKQ